MDVLQIIITLVIAFLLVVPVGKYLYKVATGESGKFDSFFDKIDNSIYRLSGIDEKEKMTWKKYGLSIIVFNAVVTIMAYIILRIQGIHFLNPNNIKGMGQSLSFNTAVSFITNTDLQNYSGETGVSYLSQMLVITSLMFIAAGTGFSVAIAFMRGIIGRQKNFGNYFVDLTRVITRVLLPLSIIFTILLISQGVPETLQGNLIVKTIEGKFQTMTLGPVASFEAIKHIGTNGGGFFNSNSAHPFENPTPISNFLEMLAMMLIPSSLTYTFGLMLKNKKQGWAIFAAMAVLFIIMIPVCYISEKVGNPSLSHVGLSQTMGNMEGKEVRFGIAGSSLFTMVTTAFTTGAVNNMHTSLMPLSQFSALWNMMLNVVFGGKGAGFMNMIMYAIITVFICGLMVGRTPEFLGKKIEGREMKLIAFTILIHPILILIPSAIAVITPLGLSSVSGSGFHGLTEVIYQYTTSAANNGSSMASFGVNTAFWNVTTGLVMFFGRYLSIILLLAVAGSLSSKAAVPVTIGTFKTDNVQFVIILIFIVLIIGALTFLPTLVLGPVAEHLALY